MLISRDNSWQIIYVQELLNVISEKEKRRGQYLHIDLHVYSGFRWEKAIFVAYLDDLGS